MEGVALPKGAWDILARGLYFCCTIYVAQHAVSLFVVQMLLLRTVRINPSARSGVIFCKTDRSARNAPNFVLVRT